MPAGICAAAERFGTVPLAELAAPAIALARDGVEVNAQQAYLFEILPADRDRDAGVARAAACDGRVPRAGDVLRDPTSADALERLGAEGAAPFYTRRHRRRGRRTGSAERGGALTARGPRGLRDRRRASRCASRYHGREVLTNPPPSAGGILIAYALGAARARGPARRRRARDRGRDGARAGRAHAGVPRRAGRARLPGRVHGLAARLDDPRLGARRRRLGVLGDVHQRRGLRARRARAPASTSTT